MTLARNQKGKQQTKVANKVIKSKKNIGREGFCGTIEGILFVVLKSGKYKTDIKVGELPASYISVSEILHFYSNIPGNLFVLSFRKIWTVLVKEAISNFKPRINFIK